MMRSKREIFMAAAIAKNHRVACSWRLIVLVIASLAVFWVSGAVAQSDGDATARLPMYGQPEIARSEDLKKTDEAFIRDATFRFGSRGAASRTLSDQGWTNMRQGMLDVAMRRFNEAWLLNPKNYQAFWGFGAVLSEQGKLTAAIEQLETARELVDEPKQKVSQLAGLGDLVVRAGTIFRGVAQGQTRNGVKGATFSSEFLGESKEEGAGGEVKS
jgi:tetratricopeptide (TPR) repeat protein